MNIIVALILLAGVVFSLWKKKLTIPGAVAGAVLGWIIYIGGGFISLMMMTLFFVSGTAATSWKKKEKQLTKASDSQQVTRTLEQVLANAGVAGLMALLALLIPRHAFEFQLMLAGSFAAATADTLSSELGMVYGRRFYNIVTFKPDEKGLDGVVSIEGTILGAVGAGLIGLLYLFHGYIGTWCFVVIVAGIIGNYVDSVLGATLERKGVINNDAVNFLNTLTGALVAGLLMTI
jgi:uncharacterized protein (TIGR00297 family)